MNYNNNNLAILIPAYNAHNYLQTLVKKITSSFDQVPIIIIDDGSPEPINLIFHTKTIEILRHPENRGKGASLKTGIRYIFEQYHANAIITIDADGQHNPEHFPQFIEEHKKNPDALLIGNRDFNPGVMPLSRIISNYFSSKLLSLKLKLDIKDSQCGFRLIPRNIQSVIDSCWEEGFQFETEFLVQTITQNHQVGFIPIKTIYNGSKSFINKSNDILQFLKIYLSIKTNR